MPLICVRDAAVLAAIWGALSGAAGCTKDEPKAPLVAGGNHQGSTPTQSALGRFCVAGAEACAEVTRAECADIVIEAEKVVTEEDVPCAERARSCADTSACLDALAQVADGGEPATRPVF